MSRKQQKYIISYDITSNKIRNKVACELENYGRRVQYSVFECELTEARYQKLYANLLVLCNETEKDSIRIYSLCEKCEKKIVTIGIQKENLQTEAVIII